MKIKNLGQVFTPTAIVKDILDVSNYVGENVLEKHIMENSCGNGAFLTEIIERYVNAYKEKHKTIIGVEKELKKYIHGIEIDTEIYKSCLENLEEKCKELNINKVSFDIRNTDSLQEQKYNGKMDFVVGNPPYVRVHNLNEQYKNVKQYSFCENGMTDLFIVFYEIGINMLKENGTLCYITPNSFYNSLAGNKLRNYIKEKQNMELLMDLGHYQPFKANTYTTICKMGKNAKFNECKYYKYDQETEKPQYITNINYKDLFIDNNIVLSNNNSKYLKYLEYKVDSKPKVAVKNGFATLNDKVFIQNDFEFNSNTIDVIKGSTGQWKKCVYPYDENGKLIPFEKLDSNVQKYFTSKKNELIKEDKKIDSTWYAFGRTQAINDVKYNKISINTCVKEIDSIKLNKVEKNQGIYSGLYMLTEIPFETIKKYICSEEFLEYLKVLNKCKSGGYYTFSSKDLSKFINCCMEEDKNE